MTTSVIALELIRIDGQTQARVGLNQEVVDDYAEKFAAGIVLPAGILFHDGDNYWLADGFHREAGARKAGLTELLFEIREGTQRDAKLYACSANRDHGLRRSNADKRRAVEMMLADKEWASWSDRAIADHCGVSNKFVGDVRRESTVNRTQSTSRTGRDGRTIDTSNIGKSPRQDQTAAPPPLWTDRQRQLQDKLLQGLTVVVNVRKEEERENNALIEWAKDQGRFEYVGGEWKKGKYNFSHSRWWNKFHGEMANKDDPAERDRVCEKYIAWLAGQPELLARIGELKGKALGCWCSPKRCHADHLAELANATPAFRIPLPPLRPGMGYRCIVRPSGDSNLARCMEIAPTADPRYWRYSLYFDRPDSFGDSQAWFDYIVRGVELSRPEVWNVITQDLPLIVGWLELNPTELLDQDLVGERANEIRRQQFLSVRAKETQNA